MLIPSTERLRHLRPAWLPLSRSFPLEPLDLPAERDRLRAFFPRAFRSRAYATICQLSGNEEPAVSSGFLDGRNLSVRKPGHYWR